MWVMEEWRILPGWFCSWPLSPLHSVDQWVEQERWPTAASCGAWRCGEGGLTAGEKGGQRHQAWQWGEDCVSWKDCFEGAHLIFGVLGNIPVPWGAPCEMTVPNCMFPCMSLLKREHTRFWYIASLKVLWPWIGCICPWEWPKIAPEMHRWDCNQLMTGEGELCHILRAA